MPIPTCARAARRGAIGLLLAAVTAGAALAQPAGYPARPIRIVVGFTPGGLTDLYARQLAGHLQSAWGQPVVVENRPGAATILGTQTVAQAAPDGYTLCFCVTNVMTNRFTYSRLPYRSEDLVPVAMGFRSTTVLVVPGGSELDTVAKLVDFARRNPGKLSYSTTGAGGATHVVGELFRTVAGIDTVPVHYKGAAPATMAVATGEVQFAFSAISTAKPHLADRRIRALGVANADRVPALPGVPTLEEAGLKGVVTSVWYGLMAPSGTPRPIVEALNRESNAFFAGASVREKLIAGGEEPLGTMTPEQMADYIAKDTEFLRRVIEPMKLNFD
jgi:tripartite-type tricarboxylate transporter receptor subunit TctC